MKSSIIETERLILRQWKEDDRVPFAELNLDSDVMKFFPRLIIKEDSDAFVDKTIKLINKNGWGLFATELKETNEFIGFLGLANLSYETHFTPCTEIGWRLHKKYWKKGYATEGSKAVLEFAFKELKKEEIVSFTSLINLPSIAVMERIGMIKDIDGDFDHPKIEVGHTLCRHVLYRVSKDCIA